MIERIVQTHNFSGAQTHEITVPAGMHSEAAVLYYIEPLNAEAELLSDQSASQGIGIPDGRSWVVGPFRAGAADRPRYLQAQTTLTAVVHVIEAYDQDGFVNAPAGTEAGNVRQAERDLVGRQTMSGIGANTAEDVKPSSNGVSGDVCRIKVQNEGATTLRFAENGNGAKGQIVTPNQAYERPHLVSAADGGFEVYNDDGTDTGDAEVEFWA